MIRGLQGSLHRGRQEERGRVARPRRAGGLSRGIHSKYLGLVIIVWRERFKNRGDDRLFQ